jgi:hypothetical protein
MGHPVTEATARNAMNVSQESQQSIPIISAAWLALLQATNPKPALRKAIPDHNSCPIKGLTKLYHSVTILGVALKMTKR